VQDRERRSQPDHGDLGARHRLGHLAQQAPVLQHAHQEQPGGADLATFGRPLYAETPFRGTGFGLGFGVVIDPVASLGICSAGEYSWGGAGGTAFWVDPKKQLIAILMTQAQPGPWQREFRELFRQLVYQAIVD